MLYFRNLHNTAVGALWKPLVEMQTESTVGNTVSWKLWWEQKIPLTLTHNFVITRKKTSRFYQDIPAVNTDQAEHFCMATQGSVGIGLVFCVSDRQTQK